MKRILFNLCFLISSCVYSQENLKVGLQAYYPFNGNANDASGNNNNPVFNNATLTSDQDGKPNSAYHFNGSNTCMRIPNNPSLNMSGSMSIALKVKPMGFYRGRCENSMLVSKGLDFEPGSYSLRFADPVLGCTNNPPTWAEVFYGGGAIASSPYVVLNKWYNVVCTNDNGIAKIYVDCVLRGTKKTNLRFDNPMDLYIGMLKSDQYPYWFNGDLDEIRIYNRALSEDEVKEYSSCKPTEMSLVFSNPYVVRNKAIKLKWNTNLESGFKDYSVERSTSSSKNFTSIGTVASIKTSTSNNYTFIDSTAKPNILYYYRIVFNNPAAKKKYSETRTGRIIDKQLLATELVQPSEIQHAEADSLRSAALFANEQYRQHLEDSIKKSSAPVVVTAAANVLQRKNDVQETIYFSADSLELSLYDNAEIDGDTVSVLLDGNIIIAKQLLSATAFVKKIAVPQGRDSIELVMYAENLGSITPNTGLLILRDGKEKHEIHFTGDMKMNATIILKRR